MNIDSAKMYSIRSRGKMRGPVVGHQLLQLVRDGCLARHDELSEDKEHWFLAGDVEYLFPAVESRFVRLRRSGSTDETGYGSTEQEESDSGIRLLQTPFYVARGSNVAGPYPLSMIAEWYFEGRLFEEDRLRIDVDGSWQLLAQAELDGLFEQCDDSQAKHAFVGAPPVWMGPSGERSIFRRASGNKIKSSKRPNEGLNSETLQWFAIGSAGIVMFVLVGGVLWWVLSTETENNQTSRAMIVAPSTQSPVVDNSSTASIASVGEERPNDEVTKEQNENASSPTMNGLNPDFAMDSGNLVEVQVQQRELTTPSEGLTSNYQLRLPSKPIRTGDQVTIPLVSALSETEPISFELVQSPLGTKLVDRSVVWIPQRQHAGSKQTFVISVLSADGARMLDIIRFALSVQN